LRASPFTQLHFPSTDKISFSHQHANMCFLSTYFSRRLQLTFNPQLSKVQFINTHTARESRCPNNPAFARSFPGSTHCIHCIHSRAPFSTASRAPHIPDTQLQSPTSPFSLITRKSPVLPGRGRGRRKTHHVSTLLTYMITAYFI